MKLDIIGSVASGKSTLAREISEKYQIPFYEKDNIIWKRTPNGDKKRSPEERDRIFREIIEGGNWIVEGTPRKCLNESFAYSDYIIFLDINTCTRLFRVFRRWIRQRIGKEKYNSK
ncbi:MAG: DNA topology modulation protein FlaR, partial [Acetatifactor sp.]|nr:DNA topology modulation protein FlaR [Acetatifactor sp.]